MTEFSKEKGEQQPQGPISVVNGTDSSRFFSMTDAVAWAVESRGFCQIQMPMEIGIQGSLEGDPNGEQKLALTIDSKTVRVPRSKGNSPGVVVSTDYRSSFYLCIPVGDYYEEPIIERGLAWVHLENPEAATMSVGIKKDHGHPPKQVLERISSAEAQTINFIRKVMDGSIPPFR